MRHFTHFFKRFRVGIRDFDYYGYDGDDGYDNHDQLTMINDHADDNGYDYDSEKY